MAEEIASLGIQVDDSGAKKAEQMFKLVGNAMDKLGKSSENAAKKLASVSSAFSNLKGPNAAASQGIVALSNALANFKAPTKVQVSNLQGLGRALGSFGTVKISGSLVATLRFLSNYNGPTAKSGANAAKLFSAISSFRTPSGLADTTLKLERMAAAANKAGLAMSHLNGKFNGLAAGGQVVVKTASHAGKNLEQLGKRAGFLENAILRSHYAFNALSGVLAAGTIIKTASELQSLRAAFTATTGSTALAAVQLEFVKRISKELSVDFLVASRNYSLFLASIKGTNFSVKDAQNVFEKVTLASRVLNLSVADTEGVFRALQQIISKGSLQSEELRQQLGDRLPGAFNRMAKALGKTTAELGEMLKKGEITGQKLKEGLGAFADGLAEDMKPGLAEAQKTIGASFARLKNAFTFASDDLGQGGLGSFIVSLNDALAKLINSNALKKLLSGLGTAFDFLGNNIENVGKILALFSAYTIGFWAANTIKSMFTVVAASKTAVGALAQVGAASQGLGAANGLPLALFGIGKGLYHLTGLAFGGVAALDRFARATRDAATASSNFRVVASGLNNVGISPEEKVQKARKAYNEAQTKSATSVLNGKSIQVPLSFTDIEKATAAIKKMGGSYEATSTKILKSSNGFSTGIKAITISVGAATKAVGGLSAATSVLNRNMARNYSLETVSLVKTKAKKASTTEIITPRRLFAKKDRSLPVEVLKASTETANAFSLTKPTEEVFKLNQELANTSKAALKGGTSTASIATGLKQSVETNFKLNRGLEDTAKSALKAGSSLRSYTPFKLEDISIQKGKPAPKIVGTNENYKKAFKDYENFANKASGNVQKSLSVQAKVNFDPAIKSLQAVEKAAKTSGSAASRALISMGAAASTVRLKLADLFPNIKVPNFGAILDKGIRKSVEATAKSSLRLSNGLLSVGENIQKIPTGGISSLAKIVDGTTAKVVRLSSSLVGAANSLLKLPKTNFGNSSVAPAIAPNDKALNQAKASFNALEKAATESSSRAATNLKTNFQGSFTSIAAFSGTAKAKIVNDFSKLPSMKFENAAQPLGSLEKSVTVQAQKASAALNSTFSKAFVSLQSLAGVAGNKIGESISKSANVNFNPMIGSLKTVETTATATGSKAGSALTKGFRDAFINIGAIASAANLKLRDSFSFLAPTIGVVSSNFGKLRESFLALMRDTSSTPILGRYFSEVAAAADKTTVSTNNFSKTLSGITTGGAGTYLNNITGSVSNVGTTFTAASKKATLFSKSLIGVKAAGAIILASMANVVGIVSTLAALFLLLSDRTQKNTTDWSSLSEEIASSTAWFDEAGKKIHANTAELDDNTRALNENKNAQFKDQFSILGAALKENPYAKAKVVGTPTTRGRAGQYRETLAVSQGSIGQQTKSATEALTLGLSGYIAGDSVDKQFTQATQEFLNANKQTRQQRARAANLINAANAAREAAIRISDNQNDALANPDKYRAESRALANLGAVASAASKDAQGEKEVNALRKLLEAGGEASIGKLIEGGAAYLARSGQTATPPTPLDLKGNDTVENPDDDKFKAPVNLGKFTDAVNDYRLSLLQLAEVSGSSSVQEAFQIQFDADALVQGGQMFKDYQDTIGSLDLSKKAGELAKAQDDLNKRFAEAGIVGNAALDPLENLAQKFIDLAAAQGLADRQRELQGRITDMRLENDLAAKQIEYLGQGPGKLKEWDIQQELINAKLQLGSVTIGKIGSQTEEQLAKQAELNASNEIYLKRLEDQLRLKQELVKQTQFISQLEEARNKQQDVTAQIQGTLAGGKPDDVEARIRLLQKENELRRDAVGYTEEQVQNLLAQEKALIANEQLLKKVTEEYQKEVQFAEDIADALTDAFRRGLSEGQNFFKNMKNLGKDLKNIFLNKLIYEPIRKSLVDALTGSIDLTGLEIDKKDALTTSKDYVSVAQTALDEAVAASKQIAEEYGRVAAESSKALTTSAVDLTNAAAAITAAANRTPVASGGVTRTAFDVAGISNGQVATLNSAISGLGFSVDNVWKAIIQQESGGRPGILGPMTKYGQAQGLSQMLPATAKAMAASLGFAWKPAMMTGKTPEAAAYQDALGREYFDQAMTRYGGDVRKAVMSYHGGPDQSIWGPKTKAYADSVLASAQKLSNGAASVDRAGTQFAANSVRAGSVLAQGSNALTDASVSITSAASTQTQAANTQASSATSLAEAAMNLANSPGLTQPGSIDLDRVGISGSSFDENFFIKQLQDGVALIPKVLDDVAITLKQAMEQAANAPNLGEFSTEAAAKAHAKLLMETQAKLQEGAEVLEQGSADLHKSSDGLAEAVQNIPGLFTISNATLNIANGAGLSTSLAPSVEAGLPGLIDSFLSSPSNEPGDSALYGKILGSLPDFNFEGFDGLLSNSSPVLGTIAETLQSQLAATKKSPLARLEGLSTLAALVGGTVGGKIGGITNALLSTQIYSKMGDMLGSTIAKAFGNNGTATFGSLQAGQIAGNAFAGVGSGLAADSVIKALGLKGSKTGGAIGGAIGNAILPGIGGFIGGALGSIVGGLFKKTKKGSAIIGANSSGSLDVLRTTGTSASREKSASEAGEGIIDTLNRIAESFGGTLNASAGAVSIGIRKKDYVVDPSGQGFTKTKNGAVNFGSDGEAAAKFAIKNLIEDGVIAGIRASTKRLLLAGDDLEAAIEKATKFESVFTEYDAIKDPFGSALKQVDKGFAELRSIFKEAGATLEEYATLEKLYAIRRNDAIKEGAAALVTNLKDLLADPLAGITDPAQAKTKALSLIKEQFNYNINQEKLNITDPRLAAFNALNEEYKNVVLEAAASGGDLVAVEQLYALKRAELLKSTSEDAFAAIRSQAADLLHDLTASTASPLSPIVAQQNALADYNKLKTTIQSGGDYSEVDLNKTVADLLDTSRTVYASSTDYFSIFNDVTEFLRQISADTYSPPVNGVPGTGTVQADIPELQTAAQILDATPIVAATNLVGAEIVRGNLTQEALLAAILGAIQADNTAYTPPVAPAPIPLPPEPRVPPTTTTNNSTNTNVKGGNLGNVGNFVGSLPRNWKNL